MEPIQYMMQKIPMRRLQSPICNTVYYTSKQQEEMKHEISILKWTTEKGDVYLAMLATSLQGKLLSQTDAKILGDQATEVRHTEQGTASLQERPAKKFLDEIIKKYNELG